MSTEAKVEPAVDSTAETMMRYREAVQARDADRVAALLSTDAVLRSPITALVQLEGRETIRELLQIVFAQVEPNEVIAELASGEDERMLIVRSSVRGEPFEEAVWLRFDEQGLIAELTVFIRPAPALLAFMAAIGPPLAARRSRAAGMAAAAMTRPLAALMHHGDPLAVRLAGVQRR